MRARNGAAAAGVRVAVAAVLVVGAAGCATTRVDEEPILENGDRVSSGMERAEAERPAAEADRARVAGRAAELEAEALRSCTGSVCEAVVRGELAPGMSEVQVFAATGTTEEAWTVRRAGGATVLAPRTLVDPPADVIGPLAVVRLEDGRVHSYGYLEPAGIRVVDGPEDTGIEGRAAGLAEMLIQQGDEYAAAGDLDRALDRYDRADILSEDPLLDYRIASVLDKQLRPIQALIQYRLFLHRLELERIEARGDAAAKLADAIAQARQRVLILERQTR